MTDLRGHTFGRLTVLHPAPPASRAEAKYPRWVVRCSCGQYRIVYASNLHNGTTRHCGCGPRKRGSNKPGPEVRIAARARAEADSQRAVQEYLARRGKRAEPSDLEDRWMA